MSDSEQIEKRVVLRAPRSRVWRAISDPVEFGAWFGVRLEGRFAPGEVVRGTFGEMPPAEVFDEMQRKMGLDPVPFTPPGPDAVFCTIERVEPEAYLSFRWHPFGVDEHLDPTGEARTLVEFELQDAGEGRTALTIRESGFERVPARLRKSAFRMDEHGWAVQAQNVARHVEGA